MANELPPGVLLEPPGPGTPEAQAKSSLGNFDNWILGGKFEHMSSSVIESAAYDMDSKKLKVRFKYGGGGKWYRVSLEKAADFYYAASKMGWIWSNALVRGPGNKGKTQVESGSL